MNDIRKRDIDGFTITLSDGSSIKLEDVPLGDTIEIKKADVYPLYVNYCALVGAKVKEWKFVKKVLPDKVAFRNKKSVRVVTI